MKFTSFLLLAAALAGCQAPYPNDRGPYGAGVRATLASQIIPPQPRPDAGHDAAAAVAAYANYQRSYVTPTPQSDSPSFGSK